MAIQAVPTISEEIYLQDLTERVKKLEGEDPRKEQAWVKIRQATEGDQLQISARNADSEVVWQADGGAREKRSNNPLEERMFKAYLVLVDAGNIVAPDGKPVFKFSEGDDYPKFDGSWADFKSRWGLIPSVAADAIELAIYKLNPQWDVFGLMTEGE